MARQAAIFEILLLNLVPTTNVRDCMDEIRIIAAWFEKTLVPLSQNYEKTNWIGDILGLTLWKNPPRGAGDMQTYLPKILVTILELLDATRALDANWQSRLSPEVRQKIAENRNIEEPKIFEASQHLRDYMLRMSFGQNEEYMERIAVVLVEEIKRSRKKVDEDMRKQEANVASEEISQRQEYHLRRQDMDSVTRKQINFAQEPRLVQVLTTKYLEALKAVHRMMELHDGENEKELTSILSHWISRLVSEDGVHMLEPDMVLVFEFVKIIAKVGKRAVVAPSGEELYQAHLDRCLSIGNPEWDYFLQRAQIILRQQVPSQGDARDSPWKCTEMILPSEAPTKRRKASPNSSKVALSRNDGGPSNPIKVFARRKAANYKVTPSKVIPPSGEPSSKVCLELCLAPPSVSTSDSNSEASKACREFAQGKGPLETLPLGKIH